MAHGRFPLAAAALASGAAHPAFPHTRPEPLAHTSPFPPGVSPFPSPQKAGRGCKRDPLPWEGQFVRRDSWAGSARETDKNPFKTGLRIMPLKPLIFSPGNPW